MKSATVKRRESVALQTLRTAVETDVTFVFELMGMSCMTAATMAMGPGKERKGKRFEWWGYF